jgi:hypothetical protein
MPAYSGKAQPYLDAIAGGVFTSQDVRDWLIAGTPVGADYAGSSALIDEQRAVRWRIKATKQPCWANYCADATTAALAGSKAAKDLNPTPFSFSGIARIVCWPYTSNSNIKTRRSASDNPRLTRYVQLVLPEHTMSGKR